MIDKLHDTGSIMEFTRDAMTVLLDLRLNLAKSYNNPSQIYVLTRSQR